MTQQLPVRVAAPILRRDQTPFTIDVYASTVPAGAPPLACSRARHRSLSGSVSGNVE